MNANWYRDVLIDELAVLICNTTHGSFYAAGVPIQQACIAAAEAALDKLESFGWGPYRPIDPIERWENEGGS